MCTIIYNRLTIDEACEDAHDARDFNVLGKEISSHLTRQDILIISASIRNFLWKSDIIQIE